MNCRRVMRCCARFEVDLQPFALARIADQIGFRGIGVGDPGQGVDRAILADRDGVHIVRPPAVLIEDRAMIGVFAGRDVVSDQVEVLDALRLSHGRLRLAGDPLAIDVHGPAGQVVQRLAVGSKREAEIAVAELVEHAASLGGRGRDAIDDLHLGPARIEAEQVSRSCRARRRSPSRARTRPSAASCRPCARPRSARRARSSPSACRRRSRLRSRRGRTR